MALEYIASTGTPSGSFLTISDIPATYNSLNVTGVISCTGTTVGDAYMRFNEVTTSTYNSMWGGLRDSSGTSGSWSTNNEGHFGRLPDDDMNVGFVYAPVWMDIFAYRGDQPGNAGWYSQGSYTDTSTTSQSQFFAGFYTEDSTTDISKIQFITSQGSWDDDSVFHLYGRTTS